MSCDAKERKTFENTKRLAEMSKEITGAVQVIYKETGKETYGFCSKEDYTEERGEFVAYV